MFRKLIIALFFVATVAQANPYHRPEAVPSDEDYGAVTVESEHRFISANEMRALALPVLKIQMNWTAEKETYTPALVRREMSGTPALVRRASQVPVMGSYIGVLRDAATGRAMYYDAVGTGKEYRKLVRAMTFRFPMPAAGSKFIFEMLAENPASGVRETVVSLTGETDKVGAEAAPDVPFEVRALQAQEPADAIVVAIYAEGYAAAAREDFYSHANMTVARLKQSNFPGVESMAFYAVWSVSKMPLGRATDLGMPIPERDSFLGLYHPYWDAFGRWYHVVYPTREEKFRRRAGFVPYDYPLVLVDSDAYWGIGNYKAMTAIPARNSSFTYLLLHEFGHFFGLNEEYEGGGRTELEFASGIEEPWSQNITFMKIAKHAMLKWNQFVDPSTMLPTPNNVWNDAKPVYGAYKGGYADSATGRSFKPGHHCTMEAGPKFCSICRHALMTEIARDIARP